MYLTVPIPISTISYVDITFVPLDINIPLRKYSIKIDHTDDVGALKQKLGALIGIDKSEIIVCDVYRHSIFKMLEDKSSAGNIKRNDDIFAYQIDRSNDKDKEIVHLHVVNRIGSQSMISNDLMGLPIILSVPYHSNFSGKDLYTLLDKYIKSRTQSQVKELPLEDLLTISKVKRSNSSDEDIKIDETPIKLKTENTIAITWKKKKSITLKITKRK